MSAWNGAGTWEEKDVSTWMRDRVKAGLLNLELADNEAQLRVDKVLACSGDARLLHVRGKFRVGFELNIKLNWSGKMHRAATISGETATGTLVIDDVSETDLDGIDVDISLKTGPRPAVGLAGGLATPIQTLFRGLVSELLMETASPGEP